MLEFGHEGVLYRNSFVMYDRGTRSLWVHTTGQAVKGELRGEKLKFLASEVVSWSVWRAQQPDTLVLDRGGEDSGFMGTFGLPDEPEDSGYSVGSGVESTLYPYELLSREGLVQHGDQLVLFLADTGSVRAYAVRADRSFALNDAGAITDGNGASWDPLTGAATHGGGVSLTRLPVTAWLIKRWRSFYGDGEIVE